MGISLCMIAKDEELFMKEFLTSIKPLVDEIIIVDTGSSDKTIEIAQDAGAKIFSQKWNDDFSKPRNLSLEKATQEWILVLDPDEQIDSRDFDKIKNLTVTKNAYRFKTRNYVNNSRIHNEYDSNDEYASMSKGFPKYWVSDKVRLFPNNKNISFKGEVHEMVEPSIEKAELEIVDTNIPVHHYSQLNEERSRKKRFFYMDITRKKVLNNPSNAKARLELAREYLSLRIYHRAIQELRKGINLSEDEMLTAEMYNKLAFSYEKLGKISLAKEHYKNSIFSYNNNLNSAVKLKEFYEVENNHLMKNKMSLLIGCIQSRIGKFDRAIETLKPYVGNLDVNDLTYELYPAFFHYNKSKEEINSVSMPAVKKTNLAVLCYHEIGNSKSEWAISFDDFKQQIDFLRSKCDFITLDELEQAKKGTKLSAAITFDDARLGVYENAFPYMQKLGIKGTLFVCTDWIQGKVSSKELFSDFMTISQVQELANAGWTIASHSVSHSDLTASNSLDNELVHSKEFLTSILSDEYKVRHFALPYGKTNDLINSEVLKYYDSVSLINFGFVNDFKKLNRFVITSYWDMECFKHLFS